VRTLLTFTGVFLLAAMATIAAAAATYRWVDADGVHYSDQPHPGAEKIFLGETQTYSPTPVPAGPPAAAAAPSEHGAAADAGGHHYDSCAVVQPAEDQVLIDVDRVTVAVQTVPAKRPRDHIVVHYDLQQLEATSPEQSTFEISPVDRGTHAVSAVVYSAQGDILCRTAKLTFHVRQASMLAPQNPNNPARGH